ncbi:MAG TPA: cell division protein CrgA [Acidimicrobiia bacterium]
MKNYIGVTLVPGRHASLIERLASPIEMPESKRRKPKNPPKSQKAIEEARKAKEPSPTWYVALMAGLMVVGVLLVLLRFILDLDQTLLLLGLAAIAGGFLMTTNYR